MSRREGPGAIAFDLDGCLVDSRPAILPSVRAALVGEGLPPLPDEELLRGLPETFKTERFEIVACRIAHRRRETRSSESVRSIVAAMQKLAARMNWRRLTGGNSA